MLKARTDPKAMTRMFPMTLSLEHLTATIPGLPDLLTEASSIQTDGDDRFCASNAYGSGYRGHPSFRQRAKDLADDGPLAGEPFAVRAWAVNLIREEVLG